MMHSGSVLLRAVFACAAAFLAFRYYYRFQLAQQTQPFKVVNVPDRGKGLVATRNIMASTLNIQAPVQACLIDSRSKGR